MVEEKINILLLEDDESVGYLLSEYLKLKSFNVSWCKTGNEAKTQLEKEIFQLVILDVMLPDTNGFIFAEKLGTQFPNLPFLFLTARSLKIDVLKGFSLGAVDYLKKPIDEEELVARIHAILRRQQPNSISESEKNTIGTFLFNSNSQELQLDGEIQTLTARENDILRMLVENKNKLTSYQDILVTLWGENDYFNRKSLNVYISNLRKYLRADSQISIENVHRKGFILKVKDS